MATKFISENEAIELRKKRQEEWERVRKDSDPIERPEESYDSRSLYDRLQEQKQKKDLEFEEAHKLKNMIKGLDDDEVDFLELVDRTKLAADKKKALEEEKELNDFRNRVASLQEESFDKRLHADAVKTRSKATINRTSQTKLLAGVVVKKSDAKKRKYSDDDKSHLVMDESASASEYSTDDKKMKDGAENGLVCIGVLPGMGNYNTSSDEGSSSSDSGDECDNAKAAIKLDLLGRQIIEKEKESIQES